MKNILYTIILSFLFSSAASAEIYKWVDDEGKVHYGEKLPNNATGKAVETIKTKDSVSVDSQAGFDAFKKGDYETALKIYRAAAEQGDINAQFHLGGMYLKGQGVTQDYKQTVKWWRLAAEQGEDIAQFYLGTMYRDGKGVTKNLVIAHMWFNTAAFSNVEALTANNKKLSEEALMQVLEKWRKNMKGKTKRLERKMTAVEIAEAQKLARQCIEKNYKDCG